MITTINQSCGIITTMVWTHSQMPLQDVVIVHWVDPVTVATCHLSQAKLWCDGVKCGLLSLFNARTTSFQYWVFGILQECPLSAWAHWACSKIERDIKSRKKLLTTYKRFQYWVIAIHSFLPLHFLECKSNHQTCSTLPLIGHKLLVVIYIHHR